MAGKKREEQETIKPKKERRKEGFSLKNKQFWAFFAVFFLLSILTILNSLKDPNVTGNAIIRISYMTGGQEEQFEVNDVLGVKEVIVEIKNTVEDGRIILNEDNLIRFDGKYYSKFTVSSTEEKKYGNMEFLLKVKEPDLLAKGIAKSDLRLYANGNELDTAFVEKKGDYLFYKAISTEFGDFVIGRAAVEEAVVEKTISAEDLITTNVVPTSNNMQESEEILAPEMPAETAETEMPLAGRAAAAGEKENFFSRIISFFKNLFS